MRTRNSVSVLLRRGLFFPSIPTSPSTTTSYSSSTSITRRHFTSSSFRHLYFFDTILSKYNARLVERKPDGVTRHAVENYPCCSCSCCQSSFCISKIFFSTSCSSFRLRSSRLLTSSIAKMGGGVPPLVQGKKSSGRAPGRLVRSHCHHRHDAQQMEEDRQVMREEEQEQLAHPLVLSRLDRLLNEKEVMFAERMKHFQFAYTRSYRYAEWCLWGLWSGLLCMLFLLFLGTYHIFSWNVIEPVTYLLGYTQILCGLWWYQRHGAQFSCSFFRKQIAESYYQRRFMRKGRGLGWCCRRLLTPPSPLFGQRLFYPSPCTRTMRDEVDFLSKMFRDIQQLRSLIRHEKRKMDLLSARTSWKKKPALEDTHSK